MIELLNKSVNKLIVIGIIWIIIESLNKSINLILNDWINQ